MPNTNITDAELELLLRQDFPNMDSFQFVDDLNRKLEYDIGARKLTLVAGGCVGLLFSVLPLIDGASFDAIRDMSGKITTIMLESSSVLDFVSVSGLAFITSVSLCALVLIHEK